VSNSGGSYGLGFLSGFFLGGLIGAGLALLLAPQRGEETREQLRERGIELRGRVDEMTARAREGAGGVVARGRGAVDEGRASVRQAIDEGQVAAKQASEELKTRFQQMRSGQTPAVSAPEEAGA
jgi:gas vesicle protein